MTEHEAGRDHTILWRRLDRPGHEAARLSFRDGHWHLTGSAVLADGGRPCRLDYEVVCDAAWRTRRATVAGWVGADAVHLELTRDAAHGWRLGGIEQPAVAGCVDVDLAFSPSTNLLPIRRLGLAVGQSAPVRTAWVRFPGFALEPLEQVYRREAADVFRYESAGGRFTAELRVSDAGLVTRYGEYWVAEAIA